MKKPIIQIKKLTSDFYQVWTNGYLLSSHRSFKEAQQNKNNLRWLYKNQTKEPFIR